MTEKQMLKGLVLVTLKRARKDNGFQILIKAVKHKLTVCPQGSVSLVRMTVLVK